MSYEIAHFCFMVLAFVITICRVAIPILLVILLVKLIKRTSKK